MGRHRRSAPVRGSSHRKQGAARAGLLSASAALTLGAVAIGTGVLPAPGDDTGRVQAGVQSDEADPAGSGPDSDREAERSTRDASGERPTPTEEPTPEETETETETPEPEPEAEDTEEPEPEPTETTAEPSPSSPDATPSPSTTPSSPTPSETPQSPAPSEDPAQQAAAEVLRLVNQERAQAGCQPLRHDGPLARLALGHSQDMAERDYFAHDTPEGRTPWDRADAAGVGNLGGENIARGQQSAEAVMNSWMNSEGHRANILNCDFATLGVGVHLGPGGPWWTQNFGY